MTLTLPRRLHSTLPAVARERAEGWGRLPETCLVVSVGLLLISLSYAGGRYQIAFAPALHWLGQLVMFLPVVLRLLSPRLAGERETFGLVVALSGMYYVVKYCYSPLEFKFPDELQHWRTTQDILSTGHLFTFNYSLPVSPVYPGLENITSAVVSVTGLSIFTAGLIVVAVARLLCTIGLYLLFRHISGSARLAGLASVLFTAAPHYKFFNAMFLYQALAFPFLVLAVYAAVRLTTLPRGEATRVWWALAVLFIAVTVMTHHVTSFLLAGTLGLAFAAFLVSRQVKKSLVLAVLTGWCTGFIVLWVIFVAPETFDYVRPIVERLVEGISGATAGHSQPSSGTQQSPLYNKAISYAGVGIIATCLPIGWYQIWRTQRTNPWALAMVVGSSAYYVTLVIRLVSVNGTEQAGRAMTYAFLPVAYVLAMAGARLLVHRTRRPLKVACTVVPASLIVLSAATLGWPPYWQLLPGRFTVTAFESSVTRESVLTAQWSNHWLYGGNRVGADITNYTLLGTYGQQNAVRNVGRLFYSPHFLEADRTFVETAKIRYLVIDYRVDQRSPNGVYFPDDEAIAIQNAGQADPPDRAALDKFNHIAGVRRIYDSGDLVIYDLKGSRYAPYA